MYTKVVHNLAMHDSLLHIWVEKLSISTKSNYSLESISTKKNTFKHKVEKKSQSQITKKY